MFLFEFSTENPFAQALYSGLVIRYLHRFEGPFQLIHQFWIETAHAIGELHAERLDAFCFLFFDVAKVRIVAESAKNFKDNLSHSCLLLLSGSRAAILRVGLVELPGEVEHEGTTSRIVDGKFSIAVDDSIGLVGIEDVDAAQVGCQ